MVSANKILTVSYGTFSCTLEGFDEPFSTMKAIAEYFRDLAADDRYFGAEPPTPDAEMLHRIAEREIQRRVEAKVQTNGVVLRASDLPGEARAEKAAPRPIGLHTVPRSETAMPAQAARPAASVAPVTPDLVPAEDVIDDFAQDRVAAKLLRIRAAVAQPETAPAAMTDEEPRAQAEATATAEAERAEAERAEAERAEAERVDAERARAAAQAEAEREEAARKEAERLEAERLEAERAQAEREEAARKEAERAGEAARAQAAAQAAVQAEEDWLPEDDHAPAPEDTQETAQELPEEEDSAEDADALLSARVLRISQAQRLDTTLEDEDAGDDLDAVDETERAGSVLSLDLTDLVGGSETSADAADDGDAETTDDGHIAADNGSETAEPALARVAQAVGDTGLSPEDEADLFHELAEVEAETASSDAGEDGRSLLESATEPQDAAMSRLMKQAETELSGPENRRRLSAIEHLRAAVAATRAEQRDPRAQTDTRAERVLGQFQDDLADVVRPRRPVSGAPRDTGKRPPAPVERIAPLILVSEQRIDRGDAPPRTIRPVRPRRLASGNLALDEDDEDEGYETAAAPNLLSSDVSFARFVETVGATDLSDLLEAAAVYCAHVEGRHSFSRPQLLRKLGELPEHAELGREEGLRGFGRLLREGRITKVRRGQFAVREGSRYLPEARRMIEG